MYFLKIVRNLMASIHLWTRILSIKLNGDRGDIIRAQYYYLGFKGICLVFINRVFISILCEPRRYFAPGVQLFWLRSTVIHWVRLMDGPKDRQSIRQHRIGFVITVYFIWKGIFRFDEKEEHDNKGQCEAYIHYVLHLWAEHTESTFVT